VYLDPAQYHADVKLPGGPGLRMYEGLNLLVRRKAKVRACARVCVCIWVVLVASGMV
jgi:hypothetical protein